MALIMRALKPRELSQKYSAGRSVSIVTKDKGKAIDAGGLSLGIPS